MAFVLRPDRRFPVAIPATYEVADPWHADRLAECGASHYGVTFDGHPSSSSGFYIALLPSIVLYSWFRVAGLLIGKYLKNDVSNYDHL